MSTSGRVQATCGRIQDALAVTFSKIESRVVRSPSGPDVFAAHRKAHYPTDAVLALNYRCNARCVMCHIWEVQSGEQLSPAELALLPPSLRTVNLSGGEPFLRDDLPDVVKAVRRACPRAKIIISTNGILTERIERATVDILDADPMIGFGVSIDGIGGKHDEVRGVRGAYERAIDTLSRLRALGVGDLRIAYTASPTNLDHFFRVYDLTRRLKIQFTCAVAHSSSHYFHTQNDSSFDHDLLASQLGDVAASELRTLSPKRWARAYFTQGLFGYAVGAGRPLPCEAGREFFFLNPGGDVYPCNILDLAIGNLRTARSFEDLWFSGQAEDVRGTVSRCKAGCWMICTARTAMQRSLPKVALWAIRSKIKAHLGFAILDPAVTERIHSDTGHFR